MVKVQRYIAVLQQYFYIFHKKLTCFREFEEKHPYQGIQILNPDSVADFEISLPRRLVTR